jgi:hypothetical protein
MKATIVDLQQREIITLDRQKGIYNNGVDNAYPQRVERIINNSVTAKAACDKAKAFLIGEGFENQVLNEYIIYSDLQGDVTLYDLLSKISHSVSRQKAAAINVQYNGNFDVSALKHVPYRNCRIGKKDSNDYSGLIHVYSNWEKRQGEEFKPQNAIKIPVFNPKKEVIQAQFSPNYMGQIALLLLDDEFVYPLAQIDPVLEDADTEAQIKGFKNGELRGGFFAKYMVYHTAFENIQDQEQFKNTLVEFQGGDHKKSLLLIPATFDADGKFIADSNIKIEKIEQNINDKIFESYEQSVANNIRKSMWNIPSILIEQQDGALFGNSGAAMEAAFEIYNAETRNIRKTISNWLKNILKNSSDPILKNADYTIKELSYGTPLDNTGSATN